MNGIDKSFREQFSATALALNWGNRHSSQDRLVCHRENPDLLVGVEITLGRYAKILPGCNGLALVVRAAKRLGTEKAGIQFHLERQGNGVDPDEINSEEAAAATAAMQQFVDKYAELTA